MAERAEGAEGAEGAERSRAEPSGAERSRAEPDVYRSNGLSRESTPEPCYFCRANGPLSVLTHDERSP